MSVNVPDSQWRLTTFGGIPVKVVSRNGSFGEEDASATEVYIIKASNLTAFALESFPLPFTLFGTIFYPRRRFLPSIPTLVTKTISWEALTEGKPTDPFASDPNAPSGTYEEFVKVTIEYGTSEVNDADDGDGSDTDDPKTFLEISSNASVEFLSPPIRSTSKWVYKNASQEEVKEIDVQQSTMQPQTEWNTVWSQIPQGFFNTTLIGRLRSKLGKVNNSVMSLFYDAPIETILFIGWSLREQFTWRTGFSGQPPVQLELKFLEKNIFVTDKNGDVDQVGHNHIWRPGEGWVRMLVNDNPIYQKAD